MLYGLKDLAAPFIQHEGTLTNVFKETKGLGNFGIYRLEPDGWYPVQKRISNWDRTFFITKDGKRTEVGGYYNAIKLLRGY